jgi:hypothetical protein
MTLAVQRGKRQTNFAVAWKCTKPTRIALFADLEPVSAHGMW